MNSKRIHSSHKEIYKIAVKLSNEVYTDNGTDLGKNMSVFFKALNNAHKPSVELRRFEQKDFRLLAFVTITLFFCLFEDQDLL